MNFTIKVLHSPLQLKLSISGISSGWREAMLDYAILKVSRQKW